MATNTFVALNKSTISGTSTNSTTINSIPSTYTDLFVVVNGSLNGGANRCWLGVQVNSISTASYSYIAVVGNGTTATQNTDTNGTYLRPGLISEKTTTTTIRFKDYANTTKFKSVISRGNSLGQTATQDVGIFANLLQNTSAISSLTFFTSDGTAFADGTTFSVYGIAKEAISPTPKATGGAIYSDSTYYYHVFGATGTFTPLQSISADVLVVAGGGGGGQDDGGGGGAGGLAIQTGRSLTATGYSITVGGGGGGSSTGSVAGTSGSPSVFDTITATGGGGGGSGSASPYAGLNGGSGGGGSYRGSAGTGTTGTSGGATLYGNSGGNSSASSPYPCGGGGGAGAVGGTGSGTVPGNGGVGRTDSFINAIGAATGTPELVSGNYYFAGGGGGSVASTGTALGLGGYGGGGVGSTSASVGSAYSGQGTNGRAFTGGGGGAGLTTSYNSGNGGSGVVIVRYLKA